MSSKLNLFRGHWFSIHAAKRGEGVAQMRAQYISLCSNNDVILRARGRGVKKVPKTACILNQCPLDQIFNCTKRNFRCACIWIYSNRNIADPFLSCIFYFKCKDPINHAVTCFQKGYITFLLMYWWQFYIACEYFQCPTQLKTWFSSGRSQRFMETLWCWWTALSFHSTNWPETLLVIARQCTQQVGFRL